ncbi:MAG: TTAGGG repeat binding factor [Caeruleum heppii]|nr:MAG: TTAGGG repeat binding factor [Caeruleum heppii]
MSALPTSAEEHMLENRSINGTLHDPAPSALDTVLVEPPSTHTAEEQAAVHTEGLSNSLLRQTSVPPMEGPLPLNDEDAPSSGQPLGTHGQGAAVEDYEETTPVQMAPVMDGLRMRFMHDNWANPSLHLCIQSLPILENLSIQLLQTLAKGSYQETLTIVTEPDSAPGQAYATLKSLFDQTKKVYSREEPFLSAHDLDIRDPDQRNIIRKANLATFVSSVFGSQDVGFYHLNEYFLETFVPDGGRLLKSQGALFLDLKTQAYLSAMANGERSRAEILEDLFPDDLAERLLTRRPFAKQMTPSEVDFVKRARSRCDHLLAEPDDEESMAALPDKYVWEDFLRDISAYVARNFEDFIGPAPKTSRGRHPNLQLSQLVSPTLERQSADDQDAQNQVNDTRIQDALRAHNQMYTTREAQHESRHDIVEKAARAAQEALQNEYFSSQRQVEQPQEESRDGIVNDPIGGFPTQQEQQKDYIAQSLGDVPDIPYHTQSAPTQVLYERARLAATAKASPNNRRAGLPSQRRPWTTEEENALMAGLDRVKGPHWSQILAMFGAGGTINESLKDRNQVQLKDKARNLKLFFLKSGIEVPYYLQFVTGELKTRAPSQALKNEARERARARGDEDRAHVEGILALASGGQVRDVDEDEEDGSPMPEDDRIPNQDLERLVAEQLQAAQQAGQAEEAVRAEQARQAEQEQQAEDARQAEAVRQVEEAQRSEMARQMEEARQAEQARKAEEAQQAASQAAAIALAAQMEPRTRRTTRASAQQMA